MSLANWLSTGKLSAKKKKARRSRVSEREDKATDDGLELGSNTSSTTDENAEPDDVNDALDELEDVKKPPRKRRRGLNAHDVSESVPEEIVPETISMEEEEEEEEEENEEEEDENEKEENEEGELEEETEDIEEAESADAGVGDNIDQEELAIRLAKLEFAGEKYDVVSDADWKQGQDIPYLSLARLFQFVEETTGQNSRLRRIDAVANFLRSVMALSPHELPAVFYLLVNQLAPSYENVELGVGDSLIQKALQQATGRSIKALKKEQKEKGDLGIVAEAARSTQRTLFRPKPLSVRAVLEKFRAIARIKGTKTQRQKVDAIRFLLSSARECEARYIVRALQGKMRINLALKTVIACLARAVVLTPPEGKRSAEGTLQVTDTRKQRKLKWGSPVLAREMKRAQVNLFEALYQLPNYDRVLPALVQYGVLALPEHCSLTPGVPIQAMLANPTNGVPAILRKFGQRAFTLEWKYDGERAQVHYLPDGSIRIFSRSAEDMTQKYPDIIANLPNACKNGVDSCILDCEVVAFDRTEEHILPFQSLASRKKKAVQQEDVTVQVCLYAFDCILLNGRSLVKEPLEERRRVLHANFQQVDGEFRFAEYLDIDPAALLAEEEKAAKQHKDEAEKNQEIREEKTKDETEEKAKETAEEDQVPHCILDPISTFLDVSIEQHCEGLMCKTLRGADATYEPSTRSSKWLKLKKDYVDGIGDSLDVVVIGADLGEGKRRGLYGSILVAVYDDEEECFQSCTKVGTGFTDDDLKTLKTRLDPLVVEDRPTDVATGYKPDVWFRPVVVMEIKCADIQVSPVHLAAVGRVDNDRGIGLRFPRFLRLRDDKTAENATSAEQLAGMFLAQPVQQRQQGPPRR